MKAQWVHERALEHDDEWSTDGLVETMCGKRVALESTVDETTCPQCLEAEPA